jgi:ribosomal protein S18 acetylase RimI-like enzyme
MNEINLKIRKVKKDELATCAKLARLEELETGPDIYPTESELKSGSKSGVFLVALINKKVVGFVLGYILSRQSGYIDLLVVDQNFRDRGIGTKLLNKITKRFEIKGVKNIWLIAHENDLDMTFYKNKDFVEGDRFRFFWKKI